MSEGNVGVRSILKFSAIYDLYQWAVGVRAARDRIFDAYVLIGEKCKLLDVGCGSGELLEYLPSHVQYTGIDINPYYIETATKKYGNRGRFVCMDVNDLDELGLDQSEYDIAVLFGLLHHLSDDEVLATLASVYTALKLGGFALTVDGVYLDGQSWVKRFILSKDRGAHVRPKGEYEALARQRFPQTEVFIERSPLRFGFLTDYLVMRMMK